MSVSNNEPVVTHGALPNKGPSREEFPVVADADARTSQTLPDQASAQNT